MVRENQYVGVVRSLHFSPEGILEVWYAIFRHVRKMEYGGWRKNLSENYSSFD